MAAGISGIYIQERVLLNHLSGIQAYVSAYILRAMEG